MSTVDAPLVEYVFYCTLKGVYAEAILKVHAAFGIQAVMAMLKETPLLTPPEETQYRYLKSDEAGINAKPYILCVNFVENTVIIGKLRQREDEKNA